MGLGEKTAAWGVPGSWCEEPGFRGVRPAPWGCLKAEHFTQQPCVLPPAPLCIEPPTGKGSKQVHGDLRRRIWENKRSRSSRRMRPNLPALYGVPVLTDAAAASRPWAPGFSRCSWGVASISSQQVPQTPRVQLMGQGQSHPKTALSPKPQAPSPLAQGQPLPLPLEEGLRACFCRPGCPRRLHQGFRPQMSSRG